MDQMDKFKELGWLQELSNLSSVNELSLYALLINLIIGFILSILVMYHYRTYSSVLTNKSTISRVLPFIILTTVLVISIVKSSLALSLGLVGALSIVRFRTPIKEPEELAYLFICIAIGLGLGANQTVYTIVATVIILFFMAFMKKKMDVSISTKDYYLSIDIENEQENLPKIIEIVSSYSKKVDLRKYQVTKSFSNIVLFIDIENSSNLDKIIKNLKNEFDGITVSFIDQSNMPII